jgi:hypothetical protein
MTREERMEAAVARLLDHRDKLIRAVADPEKFEWRYILKKRSSASRTTSFKRRSTTKLSWKTWKKPSTLRCPIKQLRRPRLSGGRGIRDPGGSTTPSRAGSSRFVSRGIANNTGRRHLG